VVVSASAYARDSNRLSDEPGREFGMRLRCRAQAAAIACPERRPGLRHSQAGLRTLLRMRSDREKAEAAMHPPTMQRAGYWFRDVSVPAPAPEPVPDEARPPALGEGRGPEPPVQTDLEAEAEQYAAIYPDRAARIRVVGGLPSPLTFGPPTPELVQAIVSGTTPNLRALDTPPAPSQSITPNLTPGENLSPTGP